MLHSICHQIWKIQQCPQDWKRSVFILFPNKGNAKNVQTTAQLHSSHLIAKKCSKFSNLGFNSTWSKNFQMFKLDLEKAEEPEIKLQHLSDHKKARQFQKNIYFCFIDDAKSFDGVDHNKLWKSLRRWEYQTTLPASWETRMQVKKQQLGPDMEQWTGFKLGKEYIKAAYCHPACLTYMQRT